MYLAKFLGILLVLHLGFPLSSNTPAADQYAGVNKPDVGEAATKEDHAVPTHGIASHKKAASMDSATETKIPEQPLYDIEPSPVHQWIALQAYLKLPSSDLKSEIASYLPTDEGSSYYSGDYQGNPFVSPDGWWNNEDAPYEQSTALIEGVWEEDKGEFFPEIDLPSRSFVHFWNPDGEYDAGLDLSFLGYGVRPSALEAAQARFYQAVAHYNIGEKTKAYYWLGRTAHLLMDLAVPAHAQLDPHWAYLNDGDNYEAFTASWEFHYKHITSSSPLTTPPSPPFTNYPRYTPGHFNENLTNLLYSLANTTDQFDSDDVNGDSDTYGNGKYRRASSTIEANKTFDKAYKINIFGQEIRLLTSPTDYIIVSCSWSQDASIIYSESFYNEINNTAYGVRVYYTDATHENFFNLDENDVPWAVCGEIFQSQLQSRAIGYTAALYQLFWMLCPGVDDNYEENDDADHAYDLSGDWGTWLHNIDGFGVHLDHDWYEISVPAGIECLYIECRFVHSEGDIDIDLLNASEEVVAYSNSSYRDVERICYDSPDPGTYYILVYQLPYSGNTYDLWWGGDCGDKIALSSPPNGYVFPSCDPEIVIKWNLSEKVNRYEVEIDSNADFSNPCYLVWSTTERDSAEVCGECGNLSPGQYYWRVRGRTMAPCNYWGEWSDTWSFKVGCPDLTISDTPPLEPPDNDSGSVVVTFDWPAVIGTSGYILQVDTMSTDWNHLLFNEFITESHLTRTVAGGQIYWRVRALGQGACPDGPWKGPLHYTDVEEIESPELPQDYELSQNYPNPFNPETRIEFTLPRGSFVTIDVYNIAGRRVRNLANERLSAGRKVVTWDGRDDNGQLVSSGIYFYRIVTDDFTESKKMILLK